MDFHAVFNGLQWQAKRKKQQKFAEFRKKFLQKFQKIFKNSQILQKIWIFFKISDKFKLILRGGGGL